tara:strand:+ start:1156 stop:1305 length:150 start_codon:yes stop_codon:yes gene_type:complete
MATGPIKSDICFFSPIKTGQYRITPIIEPSVFLATKQSVLTLGTFFLKE